MTIFRTKPCRHGTFLYAPHDYYIGRSLDLYGEYSEPEVDFFRSILRPGDVAIEAGANIGTHTIPIARFVGPTGFVFAFEPQRVAHQVLCANLCLNELLNVYAVNKALGAIACASFVPIRDWHVQDNFGGVALSAQGDPVEVVTIDSLHLQRCRLIKLDVEGAEYGVLVGASKTIERCRPCLYVENTDPGQSDLIVGLLLDHKYRLWFHTPALYNPGNFFNNPDNVFEGIGSMMLVAIPGEAEVHMAGAEEIVSITQARAVVETVATATAVRQKQWDEEHGR